MLSQLSELSDWFGPLRLLSYISVRALAAATTAFGIGIIVAPRLIARFRAIRLAHGYIDSRTGHLGPEYQLKKDTPTMGGLIIFVAILGATMLWAIANVWVVTTLLVYTALTIPGWRDDYFKVANRDKQGISLWEKIAWQSLTTAAALAYLTWHPESRNEIRELWLPFVKVAIVPVMSSWMLFALGYLWVVGFSNAINLTDGLDGLAAGCTLSVGLVLALMAYVAGNIHHAQYLLIGYVPGVGELTVVCGALIGACMAFLWFNGHPAEIFMGDTGSLALGGLIGVIAIMIHQPVTLVIVGGVFVLEALSVILQVGWFRYSRFRFGEGRRLFRMAPLHHHFQKLGWPETKVVLRFWILSLGFALLGLATLKLR